MLPSRKAIRLIMRVRHAAEEHKVKGGGPPEDIPSIDLEYTRSKEALEKYIFNLEAKVKVLQKAIEPFAEEPSDRMDTFPCHTGITTKEKCGRCSRATTAWKALHNK